jgi:hypothetical protein
MPVNGRFTGYIMVCGFQVRKDSRFYYGAQLFLTALAVVMVLAVGVIKLKAWYHTGGRSCADFAGPIGPHQFDRCVSLGACNVYTDSVHGAVLKEDVDWAEACPCAHSCNQCPPSDTVRCSVGSTEPACVRYSQNPDHAARLLKGSQSVAYTPPCVDSLEWRSERLSVLVLFNMATILLCMPFLSCLIAQCCRLHYRRKIRRVSALLQGRQEQLDRERELMDEAEQDAENQAMAAAAAAAASFAASSIDGQDVVLIEGLALPDGGSGSGQDGRSPEAAYTYTQNASYGAVVRVGLTTGGDLDDEI